MYESKAPTSNNVKTTAKKWIYIYSFIQCPINFYEAIYLFLENCEYLSLICMNLKMAVTPPVVILR